jgi:uncharacterized protein
MRIRSPHAPYIANKIAIDLLNSGLVTMHKGLEPVVEASLKVLDDDIDLEDHVDERARVILDNNEDEIDFVSADRKQLFWMIKRKIAAEEGLILETEERFNDLAHKMLDAYWNDDLMDFDVAETRIKNVIVKAILDFIKIQQDVEKEVEKKIENYKRPIVPGSDEYDMVTEKLYEEELRRRGML